MITEVRTEVSCTLPAEWAPQSAVMLTWPHRESIWEATLDDIDQVFIHVAREIARHEKLIITCFDLSHQTHIKKLLRDAHVDNSQVRFYLAYSNDIWVRDHGPVCVLQNGRPVMLDFIFNGWGNKYPADFDDKLTRSLYAQKAFGNAALQSVDLVLEGGALESDGQGTLLTTTSCILARNPKLNQDFISMRLKQLLGCERVLWLEHGQLAGDDTDGHIDTLARFINPDTICYLRCDDPNDENYNELQLMEDQLRTFTNTDGRFYNLVPLPCTAARYAKYDGRRLPLSYANFLIINGAVLVPVFDDPADSTVLDILKKAFPTREVIGINCSAAIEWYGAIHCFTMQLPSFGA